MSIAGGTEIGIAGAPWQVEVFAEYSSKKVLACGGAILDATHILTAAHCAYSPETGTRLEASAFVMAAGIAPMTAHEIESNPAAEARFVSAVRVHPMFQYSAGAGAPDDVAVLTLAKALSFDVTVQPIALAPTGASLQEGTAASLTGFGEQQYGVEGNSNLYSLSMTVAFPGRCGGEADAVFVCANSQSGSGCSGDSGSALTDGTPAALVGVMDTIELVSNQYCQAGAGNGFVNTSAPEIRAFIEGSETPPTAPRGGKGASIQGEAKVGAALSCEAGSWSGSPTVSYLFVDSANGLVLQSGASSTYIPTSGDIGRRIYCEVTASNLGGTGMARTSTLLGIREPQPAGGGEPPVAPTASDGRWFPLPAMSEPRARHTATLLGDGDVLIAGGYNGFGPGGGSNTTIGTDQLLDPATGRWLEAAPMLVARSGQTATLLRDGEVLVVGGSEMPEGKESMKTAELYDPARNTWAAAPAPAELLEAQSATLLADGRALLIGLFKGQPFPGVAGAAIYDPASGNWNRVASPKRFHYGAAVTVLPDGKVMVMGGWHSEEVWNNGPETKFTVFASVEEYDPATDRWSEAAPMNHARADQTATLMKDGRVLVVGGYDCGFARGCLGYGGSGDCCGASSAEVYDPASNTWEYTGPVLSGNEHTATLLPEGGVLVTGGNVSPISMYELSSAEIYAARYPPDEPPSSPVVTAVSAPPSIGHLAESHKRWREGPASARISARESKARRARAPLGTTFTFTLNEQATVTFTFVQQLPGRRVKGRCAAPSSNNRHRRACKLTATRGSLRFTGHSGPNTVSFQGRLSRSQKLAPGRYALLITATNAAGLRSTTRPLTFTILDPRPSGGR